MSGNGMHGKQSSHAYIRELEALLSNTNKQLLAEQLHIKELRTALAECERHAHSMAVWGGQSWKYHPPQARKIAERSCNALAKQPDTSALEKALLEAEIAGWFSSDDNKLAELYAKLAELNKE